MITYVKHPSISKGSSLIELLVYLTIITTLTITTSNVIKSFTKRSRLSILTSDLNSLIKATIYNTRINQASGQIILSNSANSVLTLVFIINKKESWKLSLPNTIVNSCELKSSSIFKNQIEIYPNGYVSPSSIRLNFISNSASQKSFALFTISRLGNVKLNKST